MAHGMVENYMSHALVADKMRHAIVVDYVRQAMVVHCTWLAMVADWMRHAMVEDYMWHAMAAECYYCTSAVGVVENNYMKVAQMGLRMRLAAFVADLDYEVPSETCHVIGIRAEVHQVFLLRSACELFSER